MVRSHISLLRGHFTKILLGSFSCTISLGRISVNFSRESFMNIVKWLNEAKTNSNHENLTFILIGNKTDLAAQYKQDFNKASGISSRG